MKTTTGDVSHDASPVFSYSYFYSLIESDVFTGMSR